MKNIQQKFQSKGLKPIIIAYLFFLILFSFVPPIQAQEELDEGLLWSRDECAKKCGQTIYSMKVDVDDKIEKANCKSKSNTSKCQNLLAQQAVIKGFDLDPYSDGNVSGWESNACLGEQTSDANRIYCYAPPMVISLNVPIGDYSVSRGLVDYIDMFYKWSLRTIALIAVIMIIFAGVTWITAAGNAQAIEGAKNRIKNAIIGLILLLFSVFILRTINPNLVDLSDLDVKMVPTIMESTYWCNNTLDGQTIKLLDKTAQAEDAKVLGEEVEVKKNDVKVGSCGATYETKLGKCTGNDCGQSNISCLVTRPNVSFFFGNLGNNTGKHLCIEDVALWGTLDKEVDGSILKLKFVCPANDSLRKKGIQYMVGAGIVAAKTGNLNYREPYFIIRSDMVNSSANCKNSIGYVVLAKYYLDRTGAPFRITDKDGNENVYTDFLDGDKEQKYVDDWVRNKMILYPKDLTRPDGYRLNLMVD